MKTNIIKEISQALKNIPENYIDEIIKLIDDSERIFLWGLGRSGMMARAFAMRLRHLGRESYFIGGLCPTMQSKDILIVISKTGRSKMLLTPIEAAKKSKTKIIYLTATRNPLTGICDRSFYFNLPESIQFGGSLFEQTMLIFLDQLVESYRQSHGISFKEMEKNHANWE
ncbi:MAG TPA: SIS domain-containing protein [bacterium]|nr:SIS domain-containing protein [bacterium]HOL35693.1 SIS domain-containing protein [bacterium]HPP09037.1 SIS domain-containing protein [bacterium]